MFRQWPGKAHNLIFDPFSGPLPVSVLMMDRPYTVGTDNNMSSDNILSL